MCRMARCVYPPPLGVDDVVESPRVVCRVSSCVRSSFDVIDWIGSTGSTHPLKPTNRKGGGIRQGRTYTQQLSALMRSSWYVDAVDRWSVDDIRLFLCVGWVCGADATRHTHE